MNCEGEYGKCIMQDLRQPHVQTTSEEASDYYATRRRRIHWVNGNNIPGAFQLNTTWYFAPNREIHGWRPRVHDVDTNALLLWFQPRRPL